MGLLLVVYLSFEALCRVGGLFFTFQRRPPVAIYLLGCLIAVCYVVKLERVLCRTCRWEGVKRWDAFRLGALFDLFLVSGHLLGVLLGFSLFLGSLFLWCCFLPFILLPLKALWRRGGIVVDWSSGRTKSSACSLGGHPSPSRSPSPAVAPFLRRCGVWDACSLFEPPLVSR